MKMKNVAARALLMLTVLLALGACAVPDKPQQPSVYDFGPGPLPSRAAASGKLGTPPLIVADIQASPALDSVAMLYRLAYADGQALRPYANARWSMAPAHLLAQRLRLRLSEQRPVLSAAQAGALRAAEANLAWTLQLDLEEFSQVFTAPEHSSAVLRLRATLSQNGKLLGQRLLRVQQPAPQADAVGGVKAMALATDRAAEELQTWLSGLVP